MRRDYQALVDTFIGDRLESAGDPPGLRETTAALAATALEGRDFEQLMRQQLNQLRHPSSTAIPDAYLADEAAIEDALQRAAAGMRVAAAQNGMMLDPQAFERAANRRLADNPQLAVRAELARVPRPATRPQALGWSLEPVPWFHERGEADAWPPAGLETVSSLRCLPGGASALERIGGGPHSGWVQIAMIERHITPARRYPDRPSRHGLICLGLEVINTEPPGKSLPFTSSPWHLWIAPWQRLDPTATVDAAAQFLSTRGTPVVALANDGRGEQWPRRAGLGGPLFLLAPVLPLVAVLGLNPTLEICGFSLSDGTGPGLVGRHWRSHLVHDGNYQPLAPAVEGADLILRPDLFARMLDIVGEARLRTGVSVNYRADDEDPEGD